MEILGQLVWLTLQSASHRHMFLSDLEWVLVPALEARQFLVWQNDGVPVAYATWALVSEETEKRMMEGHRRIAPNEWSQGDRAWLMDLVAPLAAADRFLADVKRRCFPTQTLRTFRPSANGQIEVVEVSAEPGGDQ